MTKYLMRLIFAVVIAAMTGCVKDDAPIESLIDPGDTLPYFSVVMNDGTTVTTESLRGHESMIVFFTTTCGDCRRILPQVNSYAAAHPDVKVVCIARAQTAEAIEEFWTSESLTMAYSPQPDAAVYSLFATGGVPRIYCADPSLRVTATYLEEFPL